MKKRTKVFLSILLVVVVGIAGVAIWQWNNLQAVIATTQYSTDDLEKQIAEQNEVITDAVKKLPGSFHALTEDQEKALEKGELTEQEAIAIMTGDSEIKEQEPPASESTSPSNTSAPSSSPSAKPVDDKEKQIDELVAQVYVLRASFKAKLDNLMQSAKDEYNAAPEAERTKSQKTILLKYAKKANALEGECDAAVNKILSQLEPLLKETGGDVSLSEDIKKAYYKEKSVQKAYYLSLYS